MSKITNDGLTQSGTGCFIAVPIWQHYRHHRDAKRSDGASRRCDRSPERSVLR